MLLIQLIIKISTKWWLAKWAYVCILAFLPLDGYDQCNSDFSTWTSHKANHKYHLEAIGIGPMSIECIFLNFTMSWHFVHFSSSFQKPISKPWSLGMLWIFQQVSNAICEVLQKSPLKNSNYFTSWTILPLVHLTVQLKFDFLHWPFLKKSNYAPWKYMSNGVCA